MSDISTPIWRDRDRLVSHECGGFVDWVEDEQLEGYAADPSSHELDRAFAAAVLAIRRFERVAHDERIKRLAAQR